MCVLVPGEVVIRDKTAYKVRVNIENRERCIRNSDWVVFFFQQKTAYELSACLVG